MPPTPRPGTWRTRVRIVRDVDAGATDDYGQKQTTPATLGVRSAKVRPLTGSDFREGQQLTTALTHEVELRADSLARALLPDDRLEVVDGGRVLHVVSSAEVELARRVVRVECTEQR